MHTYSDKNDEIVVPIIVLISNELCTTKDACGYNDDANGVKNPYLDELLSY